MSLNNYIINFISSLLLFHIFTQSLCYIVSCHCDVYLQEYLGGFVCSEKELRFSVGYRRLSLSYDDAVCASEMENFPWTATGLVPIGVIISLVEEIVRHLRLVEVRRGGARRGRGRGPHAVVQEVPHEDRVVVRGRHDLELVELQPEHAACVLH